MPTPTYDLIATTTLAASTSSVVFGSLPQTYRDLVVIIRAQRTGSPTNMGLRFNGDSGSNYSTIFMTGTGSSTASGAFSATNAQLDIYPYPPSTGFNNYILQIMDYSATDKHKTMLRRTNEAGNATESAADRWANTAAITTMTFTLADFNTGSTINIYGIAS